MPARKKGGEQPVTILLNRGERDMIKQALGHGLYRGLITRAELKRARSRDGLPAWLMKIQERSA